MLIRSFLQYWFESKLMPVHGNSSRNHSSNMDSNGTTNNSMTRDGYKTWASWRENNYMKDYKTLTIGSGPLLLTITILFTIISSLTASLFFKEPWLWMDEILSYTLLSDPSLIHMNGAIVSCLDANPPLFFNIYWIFAHGVSLNPFFLKIVSIVLFASTMALFYRYSTRLTGNYIINFLIFTIVISLTYLNYTLATQIRSYSLYLLLSSLYFITMHRAIKEPSKLHVVALHALTGLCLVLMHNFGLFYVAASLSFFGLLLIWSKQRAYGWVIGSYLIIYGLWLLIWYANFQVQSQVGKPYSWIPVPTFVSFFQTVGDLIPTLSSRVEQMPALSFLSVMRVLLVFGTFIYIAVIKLKCGYHSIVRDNSTSFYLMSGYMVLATISIALTVSLSYKSIFLSRYLWPNHLLILYQALYAYQHFSPFKSILFRPKFSKLLPVYIVLIAVFMFYQNKKISMFPSKILSYLPILNTQYPVFFESADYFLPIWHYHFVHAYFLLDRSTAVRKSNLPNATNDYNVITSLHNEYGVREAVLSNQFNSQNFPRFYVVDERSRFQIEHFIATGQVKIIRKIPVGIDGHQILECSF